MNIPILSYDFVFSVEADAGAAFPSAASSPQKASQKVRPNLIYYWLMNDKSVLRQLEDW